LLAVFSQTVQAETSVSQPRDLVVVIDSSNSMHGEAINTARIAAKNFCASVLEDSDIRIAVVDFGYSAQLLCSFTDDIEAINFQIERINTGGGTGTMKALEEAVAVINADGRSGVAAGIVLFSDGVPTTGRSSLTGAPRYDSERFGVNAKDASAVYAYAVSNLQAFDIWTVFILSSVNTDPQEVRLGRTLMKDLQNCGYYDASLGEDIDWTLDLISSDIVASDPFDTRHDIYFESFLGSEYRKIASVNVAWRRSFFEHSATEFDRELAIASESLCAAITGGNGMGADALMEFGFRNLQHYNGTWEDWLKTDDLTYIIGHQLVEFNGELKNLVVLLVRGTGSFESDPLGWVSNLSMTADLQGRHQGFTRAAQKAYASLRDYVDVHTDPLKDTLFLVTGHSRGAAAANLVASFMMADDFAPQDQTYAYTFATPNTVVDARRFEAPNIHNVVNLQDPVTSLPPSVLNLTLGNVLAQWTKYGQIWSYDGANDEIMTKVSEIVHNDVGVDEFELFNGFGPFKHHAHELYLAWLMSEEPAAYEHLTVWNLIGIHCPVDVEVYVGGEAIAKIERNQVVQIDADGQVLADVSGDDKYLLVHSGLEAEIRLTAYDQGTLRYEVIQGGESRVWENVVLAAGKTFIGRLSEQDVSELLIVEGEAIVGSVTEDGEEVYVNQQDVDEPAVVQPSVAPEVTFVSEASVLPDEDVQVGLMTVFLVGCGLATLFWLVLALFIYSVWRKKRKKS
jgi:hypothetical protein